MRKTFALCIAFLLFSGCVTNPLTGKHTMAFVSNNQLFPASFAQYQQFLDESTVISGTAEAEMVSNVGKKLADAAQKWLTAEGHPRYLSNYRWEYNLVQDKSINAWCMPGGKIVVYTGILPVTRTEAGLAVVLGHEIAHALMNHGQQRVSAGVLQEIGGVAVAVVTSGMSETAQTLAMGAYNVGTTVGGTLPFSRSNESEADHIGLILMAIAGYNPDEAVPFWQRMAAAGGGGSLEFLSTHPSSSTRINQLRKWTPEAKKKASQFGVRF